LFIRLIIRLFQLVFQPEQYFFSQQISQQCFSAGLSAQPNDSIFNAVSPVLGNLVPTCAAVLAPGHPDRRSHLYSIFPRTLASRARLRRPAPPDHTWGVPLTPFHFSRPCTRPAAAVGAYASIQKRGGAADAQLALGGRGGDTKAKVRQQKSEERDAIPDLLLKHPDITLATCV
jgi:hypothetical protein